MKLYHHIAIPRSLTALILALFIVGGCGGSSSSESRTWFTVLVENISAPGALQTSSGARSIYFSYLLWVLHQNDEPIFASGSPVRDNGLETLAEQGDPGPLAEGLQIESRVSLIGIVTKPVDSESASVLGPGQSYSFRVSAGSDTRLSLVSMFLHSNDVFLSASDNGIALFDSSNNPVSGDFTAAFQLFDAGTEVNQEPGTGADQPFSSADTGTEEQGVVQPVNDGYSYPAIASMLRITITPEAS